MTEGTAEPKAFPPATVGRIVHFFQPGKTFNGTKDGPFAAIVTQTFPNSKYVNLKVLPPFDAPFDAGSVCNVADALTSGSPYWQWPERA